MWPTFNSGDRVLVRRAPLVAIRRNEIVVVESPTVGAGWSTPVTSGLTDHRWLIKRAVALPGDTVPQELATVSRNDGTCSVPDGSLLVLGDNPTNSVDSRMYGCIPGERVLGVVLRRIGKRRQRAPEVTGPSSSTKSRA
jgi:signal peptidase I